MDTKKVYPGKGHEGPETE